MYIYIERERDVYRVAPNRHAPESTPTPACDRLMRSVHKLKIWTPEGLPPAD